MRAGGESEKVDNTTQQVEKASGDFGRPMATPPDGTSAPNLGGLDLPSQLTDTRLSGPPACAEPSSAETETLSRKKFECLRFLSNLYKGIKKQQTLIQTAQREDLDSVIETAHDFMDEVPDVLNDARIWPLIQSLQEKWELVVEGYTRTWSDFWQALDEMTRTGSSNIMEAPDSAQIHHERTCLSSQFQTIQYIRDASINISIMNYLTAATFCHSACLARKIDLRRVKTDGLY